MNDITAEIQRLRSLTGPELVVRYTELLGKPLGSKTGSNPRNVAPGSSRNSTSEGYQELPRFVSKS